MRPKLARIHVTLRKKVAFRIKLKSDTDWKKGISLRVRKTYRSVWFCQVQKRFDGFLVNEVIAQLGSVTSDVTESPDCLFSHN